MSPVAQSLCPGLFGGVLDAVNETIIQRNGEAEILPGKFSQLLVHPGETVTFLTAGGGYGEPAERDAASVERDLKLGFITRGRAGKDYPVCISAASAKP